jgi:hypothetical protein
VSREAGGAWLRDDEDGPWCSRCGGDVALVTCWQCFGDRGWNRSDDDPIQFGEDDWLECDACDGAGGFWVCRDRLCTAKDEA